MGTYRGKNFNPFNNYIISASTSSANQVVVQPASNDGAPITPATDIMVSNNTASVAYIVWGLTTQTATSANVAVLPGETMVLDMAMGATNVAVLLASGSGNVYVSIGVGV